MDSHKTKKSFKCDVFEMEFHLKWRLNKHTDGHTGEKKTKCHYFNNKKTCPFSEIGCKFQHEESAECLFKEFCTNDKCQFRHNN